MADIVYPIYGAGASKTLKDMGDGTFAEVVAFTADSPVQLTGDVVVDTLGALDDAKVTDPDAASATLPALMRGLIAALDTLNTAIGAAGDSAGDNTVIGQLKQIAANTAP